MQTKELILKEFSNQLTIERKPDIVLNPYKFIGLRAFNSECKIEIWEADGKAIVLFTELSSNKGTSVTNSAEQLVFEIYNRFLISKYKTSQCLFAETYGKTDDHTISVIVPEWDELCQVVSHSWVYLGKIIKQE